MAGDRGQPDRLVKTALQTRVTAAMADLRGASEPLLLQMIADARVDLPSRIAAGNVLALAVDPRIVAFSPQMIRIPGGEVAIGLDPDRIDAMARHLAQLGLVESWIARDVPRHRVHLRPYALARFPVTHGEYRTFLISTGFCEVPGSWAFGRYPAERANHPVYGVSSAAAEAYARWLAWCTGRGATGSTRRCATPPKAACATHRRSGCLSAANRRSGCATWPAMSKNMLPMMTRPTAPTAIIPQRFTGVIASRAAAALRGPAIWRKPGDGTATTRVRRLLRSAFAWPRAWRLLLSG
jgi:hypothetical protein